MKFLNKKFIAIILVFQLFLLLALNCASFSSAKILAATNSCCSHNCKCIKPVKPFETATAPDENIFKIKFLSENFSNNFHTVIFKSNFSSIYTIYSVNKSNILKILRTIILLN